MGFNSAFKGLKNIGMFAVQGNNKIGAYREVCCTGNIRV
jgi:hypothetical protein